MQRNRLYLLVALTAALLGSESIQTGSVVAQQSITASQKEQSGLKTATFNTPQGKINVNLPDDMAATDEISGTVIAEAVGKTPEEKEQNTDELNGYVVEVAKTEEAPKVADQPKTKKPPKVNPKEPDFTCVIPPAVSLIKLILRNSKGTQVCTSEVPCLPTPPPMPCPEDQCIMPTVGSCGRPVQIKAPGDGHFSNSGVTIGGTPAKLLAESPRQTIAKSPTNVVGPTEIQRQEGNRVAKGKFNNLRVKMVAGKLGLQKGESTSVTVRVDGLEGMKEPVRLQIENRTPDVVTMSGGNTQEIIIRPEDVSSN